MICLLNGYCTGQRGAFFPSFFRRPRRSGVAPGRAPGHTGPTPRPSAPRRRNPALLALAGLPPTAAADPARRHIGLTGLGGTIRAWFCAYRDSSNEREKCPKAGGDGLGQREPWLGRSGRCWGSTHSARRTGPGAGSGRSRRLPAAAPLRAAAAFERRAAPSEPPDWRRRRRRRPPQLAGPRAGLPLLGRARAAVRGGPRRLRGMSGPAAQPQGLRCAPARPRLWRLRGPRPRDPRQLH